jgi:AraC-like DNA-binding protein
LLLARQLDILPAVSAKPKGPTYAVQLAKPFWKVMRRYPQISSALLDQLEATPPDARLPVAAGQELLRSVVELTGEQDLGLLAARETELGGFAVLEYASASAPTWGEALQTLFRYSHLVNSAADFRLEQVADKARVVLHSTVPLTRAGTDYQSAAFHVAVSRWQQPAVTELEAWFPHPEPSDLSEYRATYGTARLVFGAPFCGFVFDAERLQTPLPSNEPALHGVLRQHADRLLAELAPRTELIAQVRSHLLSTLRGRPASAVEMAEKLGMTRRTLTRRLREEGTSFSEVLDELRHRTAVHYLESTQHSVEDIAFLVGFSEPSPFVRAFRRWTGMAPMAYRRGHPRP